MKKSKSTFIAKRDKIIDTCPQCGVPVLSSRSPNSFKFVCTSCGFTQDIPALPLRRIKHKPESITLRRYEFQYLIRYSTNNSWPYDITLSFNPKGAVWYSHSSGRSPRTGRGYISFLDAPCLERILPFVLEFKSGGGSFHLTEQSVSFTHYEGAKIMCILNVIP